VTAGARKPGEGKNPGWKKESRNVSSRRGSFWKEAEVTLYFRGEERGKGNIARGKIAGHFFGLTEKRRREEFGNLQGRESRT